MMRRVAFLLLAVVASVASASSSDSEDLLALFPNQDVDLSQLDEATISMLRGYVSSSNQNSRRLGFFNFDFSNLMFHLHVCDVDYDYCCSTSHPKPAGPLGCGCPNCDLPHAHHLDYCRNKATICSATSYENLGESSSGGSESSSAKNNGQSASKRFNWIYAVGAAAAMAMIVGLIVMRKRKTEEEAAKALGAEEATFAGDKSFVSSMGDSMYDAGAAAQEYGLGVANSARDYSLAAAGAAAAGAAAMGAYMAGGRRNQDDDDSLSIDERNIAPMRSNEYTDMDMPPEQGIEASMVPSRSRRAIQTGESKKSLAGSVARRLGLVRNGSMKAVNVPEDDGLGPHFIEMDSLPQRSMSVSHVGPDGVELEGPMYPSAQRGGASYGI